jgi:hypothetical protein
VKLWAIPFVVASATGLVWSPTAQAEVGPERVGSLLSQDQYVAGVEGSSFTLSLFLQGRSTLGDRAPTSILVTSHQPIESRVELHEVLDGDLPSNVDTLEIAVDESSRTASGVIDLVVPIEIGSTSPDRLQMSATGVYPISIALAVNAEVTDRIVTFVERLPEGTTAPEEVAPLLVSILGLIPGDITLRPDGSTVVSDADRTDLNSLVAAAESLPGVPFTVGVRPELVEGLSRSTPDDGQLLASLQFTDAMTYLSMPYVSIRPGTVVDTSFSESFLEQLRLGDDALSDALPLTTPRRIAWPIDHAPSAPEAQFVRDVGYRSILLLPDAQDDEGLEVLQFVDPTRLVDLELPNRGTIEALVVDPRLSAILTEAEAGPTSDTFLAAQHVLADLKMLRSEIAERGETINGRSIVLATRDGSLMSVDALTSLVDTLASSGLVELVDLDTALSRTAVGLADGRPVSIGLPTSNDQGTTDALAVIALGSLRADAYASMLPDGDGRPAEWRQLLDVATDDRFTDEQRQQYVDVVVAATDAVASAVIPPAATSFTLGGRVSQIRLGLRNDGEVDLQVRLRLSSPKLIFPDGEPVVLLPAGSLTPVEIAVEARSNGRFPVTVQLVTPEGSVTLTEPIVFTARVNALAGLGQVVTGVALLLLATWWVHHWRVQYRRRQSAVIESTSRHPSGDGLH